MLSNIASIEIPPIEETLIAWLERQPRTRLVRLGVDPEEIDDHAFYPRLALGEYFLDQFNGLIDRAREHGVSVEITTYCRVTDISAEPDGLRLTAAPKVGEPSERLFDQIVIATGHQWPEEPEVRPGYFLSPWPATALQRIPATRIGVRGSSLTAIDAAVALAVAHGSFIETQGDAIDYRINPGNEALSITMMSRKGLLPEADFYHPVPYEPLEICTPEAINRLIDEACLSLIDRAYDLFKRELAQADPDYAAHIGLADLALEDFAEHYFADRVSADPFDWAIRNLRGPRRSREPDHGVVALCHPAYARGARADLPASRCRGARSLQPGSEADFHCYGASRICSSNAALISGTRRFAFDGTDWPAVRRQHPAVAGKHYVRLPPLAMALGLGLRLREDQRLNALSMANYR